MSVAVFRTRFTEPAVPAHHSARPRLAASGGHGFGFRAEEVPAGLRPAARRFLERAAD